MIRNGTIVRQTLALMRDRIPDLNLSHVEVFLALTLSSQDPMPIDLANQTGLAGPSITRLIKDMMTADLVEVLVDTNNMRHRRIRLLPAGVELARAIDQIGERDAVS